MRKIYLTFCLLAMSLLAATDLGQSQSQFSRRYEGPDDPAGDQAAVRSGRLTGNRMFFLLNNNSSICDTGHGQAIWNKWPDLYTGFTMMHGVNAIMAARLFIEGESTPVTDPDRIAAGDYDHILYSAQHGWRGRNDLDPTGTIEWGMKPVITYMNPLSETMALSNDPNSWPVKGWPARGDELKWPGEWDGRFGRGVIYADLEAYYIINDAQDMEHLGPEDSVKYFPRPGIKIGYKDPNVTIQKGMDWGGIGLREAIRVFQWNNPQARDAVFLEYTTANISDYDLPEMCFGFYLHPWIGQDQGLTGDDYLFFDKQIDMAYNWDRDGKGEGGIPTGAFGMAYLESPANPFDGRDNDDDGLIDESRENAAARIVGPYEGITNLSSFLRFYNLTEDQLKPHWDADEDGDWQDGNDLNGNGVYDAGEDPGDDVGLDGVGPGELNYSGPDEGECNHRPDFLEGIGCEPNFAFTDVSESDMLGLTSFHTYDHQSHPAIHSDDEMTWRFFSDASFDPFKDQPGEWVNLFATGTFTLHRGRTERISMGLVASYDPAEGLNSPDHSAPSLYRKKEVAQIIYERDYRFTQPPKMPTLNASAGDGKVILTWDDVAERYTREPLLRNANDFEGYKLFKSTDKNFLDAEIITDGYGTRLYKRPIFQCDLINKISGFAEFGLVDGVAYFLGNDTGIQHFFIDTKVQNGKTYYYALVAYDRGIPELGTGVTPSENNTVIELDEAEEVRAIGRNVAIATPRQSAAGYVPARIQIHKKSWPPSTGDVTPIVLAPGELMENHTYKVAFDVDTVRSVRTAARSLKFTTNGYHVYDLTDNNRLVTSKVRINDDFTHAPTQSLKIDSLSAYTLKFGESFFTDAFEGLCLSMVLNTFYVIEPKLDYEATGWRVGNYSNKVRMEVKPTVETIAFPWEYEVIFGDPGIYKGKTKKITRVRDENGIKVEKNQVLLEQEFNFKIVIKTFPDSLGEYEALDLIVFDNDGNGVYEPTADKVLVGYLDTKGEWFKTLFTVTFQEGSEMPQPNDVYRLTFKRPFFVTDSLTFTVLPSAGTDKAAIPSAMDDIQVVPNPYVATNNMEPAVANQFLNQRRRLMFTHLPARCDVKIFTVSGVLVDEFTVDNSDDNGTAFWNLLTKEGLEIAAGVYIYHVKAKDTGDEKLGKFSVIK